MLLRAQTEEQSHTREDDASERAKQEETNKRGERKPNPIELERGFPGGAEKANKEHIF